jgi:NAD(P)H-nitrite reductase large subunit
MGVDNNALMNLLTKPYKLQIVQTIIERGQCTAKELMDINNDVPQATLYRMLKSLVNDEILFVVEEKKVRALKQKIYSVNPALMQQNNSVVTENDGEGYFKLFSSFLMTLLKEFKDYSEKKSINILKDGSGFSAVPIYATIEELQEMSREIGDIVKKYQTKNIKSCGEQKIHILATILTPPKKIEEESK